MSRYRFDKSEFLEAVEEDGLYLVNSVIEPEFVHRTKRELEAAIEQEARYHGRDDHPDHGMVLVCAQYGGAFLELYDNERLMTPFELLLGEGCIVYANTSSSMPPHQSNYSARVHVDSPRVTPGYVTNFMALILLDDFTEENGATWYLPGSHRATEAPQEEYFFRHAKRLVASAGSVLFWHPRVFHAGGTNTTAAWHHALTLVMCRPYMKQRLDLPRLLAARMDTAALSKKAQQKIGFLAQVPASYEEYYAPPEQRKFRQKTE